MVSSPQRVNAEGFTLKELIAWAYRADVRHVDLPAELDARARYDARLDLVGPHSWPAIDRLVQQGINRHFAIEVTHETKLLDVFVLTAVDRPSPGRRRHDDEPQRRRRRDVRQFQHRGRQRDDGAAVERGTGLARSSPLYRARSH